LVEPALLLILCTLVAIGIILMGRPDVRASAFWTWGWLFAVFSGVLRDAGTDLGTLELLSNPLSTLFAAFMLTGALAFARRETPPWLIPASIGVGICRAGFASQDFFTASHGLALAVEPPMILAASFIMFRDIRGPGRSAPQRLVAPALIAVAGISILTHPLGMPNDAFPEVIVLPWLMAASFTLSVQLVSVSDRIRQELSRAVDTLEERVAERTAHLEREIVERRTAEAALRASEERANTILELNSDYTFAMYVHPDGRVSPEWLTGPLAERLGFDSEKFLVLDWMELVHSEDREGVEESLNALTEGDRTDFQLRVITARGEVLSMHIHISAVRDERDGTVRYVGAARDVSDRIRAEEEQRTLELHMQEVQRLESLGVLAGGIAHDFNNLLTVILGNSRVLMTDLASQPLAQKKLGRLRDAAKHAADLVDQMLTYSGKAAPAIQPIDLSTLIDSMRELLRASVSSKCQLEIDLAPHLPSVEGDATQIRQVALNLVTNAGEALASRGGKVTVSTGIVKADAEYLADTLGAGDLMPGEFVYLEVSDTGPGIDHAARARIFEPFYTTKFSGRGLGLAAVLGIVRSHGGAIKIISAPDMGTSFRVLYLRSASRAAAATLPSKNDVGKETGTVLLVDDDDGVLEISTIFLELEGFRVIPALGGREGIDLFAEQADEIDVVVVDLAMPEVDGERVFAEIHHIRSEIPVVLASGFSEEMARKRIAADGFSGFIQKPYEPEELAEAIRSVLEDA